MEDNTSPAEWSPGFIGIGAEKSATTWAWSQLNAHPGIEMSQPKELNYFNQHFDRGAAWYRRHFSASPSGCLTGEISPLYMDCPFTAERIAATYPDVPLLVLLRHPLDRALSHLMHDAQNAYGGVANVTTAQLLRLAERDNKYSRRSCYAASLQPFFERFPRKQIGIFFFDDVKSDPETLLRRLYTFVGADTDFVPEAVDERINRTKDYRSVSIHRVLRGMSMTANSFPPSRAVMEWLYRNTQLRERTLDLLMVDGGRPDLTPEEVLPSEQLNAIREDLEKLSTRIEVPAAWRVSRESRAA
ncbi:MAG: sulfotransferase [Planctomycetaceae bacterium]|nr:sulfotransferase [Planctomycetaceae bacterium]